MEDRELLRQLALGRVAVGVASIAAPGITMRGFIGGVSSEAAVKALTRSFGIRDGLLGLGTLQALDRDERVKEWIVAGLVADATDLTAALLAGRTAPKRNVALMAVAAGGATVIGAILASRWG